MEVGGAQTKSGEGEKKMYVYKKKEQKFSHEAHHGPKSSGRKVIRGPTVVGNGGGGPEESG